MAQHQTHTQGLVPLSDAHDLKVAEGNEDVRGWEVRASDRQKVGKVKDLIVDPNAMRTKYLDVELDSKIAGTDRRVLIPVGAVRLDDKDDAVLANLSRDEILRSPAYDGRIISSDYESQLRSSYAGAFGTGRNREVDETRFFSDQGLLGGRRGRDKGVRDKGVDEARMTVAEEELAIGKRQVPAGEAYLRKHVETEHVREPVTRMREEVTVERHPVENRAASGDVQIGEQEIRVPVTEEEIVVEKRPVVKEEVVVKKRAVEETDTVEADVRRERVDVDESTIKDREARRGRPANEQDRTDRNPRP